MERYSVTMVFLSGVERGWISRVVHSLSMATLSCETEGGGWRERWRAEGWRVEGGGGYREVERRVEVYLLSPTREGAADKPYSRRE
jgi:hypothetical protein